MIDRSDPHWYKDAIIYQLHVKAFFDANDDGIGDFAGLMQKLDYVAGSRRHRDLAAAVLSVAVARRRLRHRRLPRHQPGLRHHARLPAFRRRGAQARHPRHHRAGDQPHLGPASLVPAGARKAKPGSARAQFLRVERHRPEIRRHAHHLPRHRDVELDLGPGGAGLFLAPLLFAPAGPEFRQSPRAARKSPRSCASGSRWGGRAAARRRALSGRARRHQQREPARDPCGAEEDPRRGRRALSRPHAAGRGQSVAGGRAALFRRRRRVPHGVPLPADAAHVHGAGAGGPPPDHRHHRARRPTSPKTASGRSSCATTTS